MMTAAPHLRRLEQSATTRELDLASELFHRINRVIPQDQKIPSVSPTCAVRDVVALMRQHGYSQIPVIENSEVLGVFSLRAFAEQAAAATLEEWNKERCAPGIFRSMSSWNSSSTPV